MWALGMCVVCIGAALASGAGPELTADWRGVFAYREGLSGELSAYFDGDRTRAVLRLTGVDGGPYTSPIYSAWSVRVGDLEGDGREEVVLGVWARETRHGEESPHRAVWVLGWRERGFVALWRGSAMARPLDNFDVLDLDGDGRDELLALERGGGGEVLSVYRWNGFGFGGVKSVAMAEGVSFDAGGGGCVKDADGVRCFRVKEGELYEMDDAVLGVGSGGPDVVRDVAGVGE